MVFIWCMEYTHRVRSGSAVLTERSEEEGRCIKPRRDPQHERYPQFVWHLTDVFLSLLKISFPVRSMKRAWALTDCNLTEAFVVESSTQWHLQLPDLQINWSHSNSIAMASRIQMPCWGDMRRDWQPDHGHFLQKKGKKKTKQNWMIHLVSVHKLLSASLAFHHFLPVLLALMTFYHFSKAASSHNNWCSLSIWIREHL